MGDYYKSGTGASQKKSYVLQENGNIAKLDRIGSGSKKAKSVIEFASNLIKRYFKENPSVDDEIKDIETQIKELKRQQHTVKGMEPGAIIKEDLGGTAAVRGDIDREEADCNSGNVFKMW